MAADDLTEQEGGTSGSHPVQTHPVLVGPTTSVDQNTIRAAIIPVACFRLDDIRFDFDSSFIRPEAAKEFKKLSKLIKEHPGAPLSVFGHADPTGNDDYNKRLSGRRAIAIYALLVREPDRWEKLFKDSEDHWGLKSTQTMLRTVGHEPGNTNGVATAQTRDAVKAFQSANGLSDDGDPGPLTRAKLYPAYMDKICVDEAGQPFKVQKSEFLGKGADAGGKADFQGCSEFNPVLMFSQAENQAFQNPSKKAERDSENAPNRRVMVLLFRPGSKVNPTKWPCPRATEGTAGCRERFWSDAAQRRQFQAVRRKFEDTKDTFACRFYHRLTVLSPCESVVPPRPLATLEFIFDTDNNHVVGSAEPVTPFARVGIFDRAFNPANGNIVNTAAEAQNFVGADSRRFYLRVKDPDASGRGEITAKWFTLLGAGGNDDKPTSQDVTLLETTPPGVFVSRGLFVAPNSVDIDEITNSGLPAGHPETGDRARNAANHRTRAITVNDTNRLDSRIQAEYTSVAGGLITASIPVFNRAPEERLKIKVHLVNVRDASVGGAPVLTAARKQAAIRSLQETYAPCGVFVEIDEIIIDPPASCINWGTRYPFVANADDPSVEAVPAPVGGRIQPSTSMKDIIDLIRARPDFDSNDIYLVYVLHIFRSPVPPPQAVATDPGVVDGSGGQAFADIFTVTASNAAGFAFLALDSGITDIADPHEMGHIVTDLNNTAGGHFHLGAAFTAAGPTAPGNIDGRNLMHAFFLDNTQGIKNPRRLWDEDFTNSNITPSTIPAQIAAIRGSRFTRPI